MSALEKHNILYWRKRKMMIYFIVVAFLEASLAFTMFGWFGFIISSIISTIIAFAVPVPFSLLIQTLLFLIALLKARKKKK